MNDSDSGGTTSSDSDSSSELNVGSKRFNPLKALCSTKFKVPVAHARVHDNVQTLEARQNTIGGFTEPYDDNRIKQIREANSSKMKLPAAGEVPRRRFLPEQGPVQSSKSKRHTSNVFVRMEKGYEGPLALMQTWMNDRTRVRIYIRKQKGIRGHVSGVIELFDRHWNMAVSDVSETWTRRNYRYSTNSMDPDGFVPPEDCSDRLRELGIVLPKTKARCDGKKNVIITRKVPKLLIRGDQVALVTLEPTSRKELEPAEPKDAK